VLPDNVHFAFLFFQLNHDEYSGQQRKTGLKNEKLIEVKWKKKR
jgi:hypothetical protein